MACQMVADATVSVYGTAGTPLAFATNRPIAMSTVRKMKTLNMVKTTRADSPRPRIVSHQVMPAKPAPSPKRISHSVL